MMNNVLNSLLQRYELEGRILNENSQAQPAISPPQHHNAQVYDERSRSACTELVEVGLHELPITIGTPAVKTGRAHFDYTENTGTEIVAVAVIGGRQ